MYMMRLPNYLSFFKDLHVRVEMILDGLIMFPKIDLRLTNKINID
jgi:hypothetical protein